MLELNLMFCSDERIDMCDMGKCGKQTHKHVRYAIESL